VESLAFEFRKNFPTDIYPVGKGNPLVIDGKHKFSFRNSLHLIEFFNNFVRRRERNFCRQIFYQLLLSRRLNGYIGNSAHYVNFVVETWIDLIMNQDNSSIYKIAYWLAS
jgi:hypothetical protein